jgi:phage gp46-like protein
MYTITPNGSGADLSYTPGTSSDLFNNVYLSLEITKGTWWFDQGFGLRRRAHRKNTAAMAVLLQQDCRDALQWLLGNGRATSIEVSAIANPDNRTWLGIRCTVTAASGETVTYDKFTEVV